VLRIHLGTEQVDARVRRLAGVVEYVLLDVERPIATFAGDRAILREPGRGEVVGGVAVLDPRPPRGVSRRRMTSERLAVLASAVAEGDADQVEAAQREIHGFLPNAFAADVAASLGLAAAEAVAAHHDASPLSGGLPLPRARAALLRRLRSVASVERRDAEAAATAISRLLDDLVADRRLARDGDALRDPARSEPRPAAMVEAMARLEAALSVPAPPSLAEAATAAGCPPEGVRALQADGRIVRIGTDLAWSTATYRGLAAMALELARDGPLSPAAFRDASRTSRKYVLAILEDLDRRQILMRTPEGHVPGPRAPRPQPAPADVAR
jgi:selenocysteine-specific elongation factor